MVAKKRRRFKPSDKLRIVLSGLSGEERVSDICRREGISTVQYYSWKKRLLSSADEVYGNQKRSSRQEEELIETVVRKDHVIAHLTEENLEFKKNPGAVLSKYLRRSGGR
ncbi:MAG: transposase [Candidatus Electryonea clarkiae]|nr:transposase [Candidatus Electryonea clarkiae]MDP8289171.1 transposase [Candidatus Electryonea clarkiae]